MTIAERGKREVLIHIISDQSLIFFQNRGHIRILHEICHGNENNILVRNEIFCNIFAFKKSQNTDKWAMASARPWQINIVNFPRPRGRFNQNNRFQDTAYHERNLMQSSNLTLFFQNVGGLLISRRIKIALRSVTASLQSGLLSFQPLVEKYLVRRKYLDIDYR